MKNELQGYADHQELPDYRLHTTAVMGVFTGPMRSQMTLELAYDEDFDSWFQVQLRQPLVELQSLADAPGEKNPQRSWPPVIVQAYEKKGVFRLEFHGLFSAANLISRQLLLGVVDTVRSRAMEFALDLQMMDPSAGSVGGPTVTLSSEIAQTVINITNNITGHGTNIAAGSGIQIKSVVEGNADAVKRSARELGLTEDDAEAFAELLVEERDLEGPRTRGFLDRVRAGTIQAGGSVTSNVVASALVELGKSFLGII